MAVIEESFIAVDVWGKEGTEHVARFVRPLSRALELIARELKAGFQCNVLSNDEVGYAITESFDRRSLN
jgi:Flp pilus assembly protein TadB